ncbi:hypothetical protein [Granulicella sp. S156]|uniref:hypothetical protein n=1 Tax=Granulicella sp. S156 TaxID=1747224 RepID=UPI00131E398C|nr:hypothetical protein [Granulicella sp. S156]
MNQWDQRIKEHQIWAELQALGPLVDRALGIEDSLEESRPGIERLRTMLSYCGKRLAAADPSITTPAPLDEMATALLAVRNEIEAYISDKVGGHIINANATADRVLAASNQLPGAYSPEELGALISISTEQRALAEESLSAARTANNKLHSEITGLQSRLNELATLIDAEKQKLVQVTTDYQGQFSASQDTRSKEFTDTLRTGQQDLTKLVADYQGQFSTGQDARSKEFAEAQGVRQTKYGEVIAAYEKSLSAQDTEFTKQRNETVQANTESLKLLNASFGEEAESILKSIREKEENVEKLVGVIGNLGVTSGYLLTANRAQKGMWIWQGLTVLSLSTLTVLAYRTLPLLEDASGHFNWGGFAGRVLLLVSLGVIAGYSGSQADKLFLNEKRNRKLALELEAIGPYLAPLPIEDQNKFRINIGDRSFGQEIEATLQAHHKSPASILDLLLKSKQGKELLELIVELAKKTKG